MSSTPPRHPPRPIVVPSAQTPSPPTQHPEPTRAFELPLTQPIRPETPEKQDQYQSLSVDHPRGAMHQVAERGISASLAAIAKRLQQQREHPEASKADRSLAVVEAELSAMLGQNDRVADCFEQLNELPSPLTLASLAQAGRALQSPLTSADALAPLTRLSESKQPALRCHALLRLADLERVVRLDEAGSRDQLKRATQQFPQEPRVVLRGVLDALRGSGAPRPLSTVVPRALLPVSHALEALCVLLASPTGPSKSERALPAVAFRQAASSLYSAELSLGVDRLSGLSKVPGLGTAALWLMALAGSASPSERARSVGYLEQLLEGGEAEAAVSVLVDRALELRDSELWRKTRAKSRSHLDDLDRSLVGELLGTNADPAATAPPLQPSPELAPLSAALLARQGRRRGAVSTLSADALATLRLGEALAASHERPDDVAPAVTQWLSLHHEAPLGYWLRLERALADQALEELRELLLNATETTLGLAPGLGALSLGLLGTTLRNAEFSREGYGLALELCPVSEAALRALLMTAPSSARAPLLEQAAAVAPAGEQRALLLIEAALEQDKTQPQEQQRLLVAAYEQAPQLPLAAALGEYAARRAGNVGEALTWLRRRTAHTDDPIELAFDSVREALLLVNDSPDEAARLLEQALLVNPLDLALRLLAERLQSDSDGSDFRLELASELPQPLRSNLEQRAAAVAALRGDRDGVRLAISAAAASLDDSIGERWLEACAGRDCPSPRLFDRLFQAARQETHPIIQRELYERLGRIDPSASPLGSMLWCSAILERAPQYLPSLRQSMKMSARAGHWAELSSHAGVLAETLDRGEALGYAELATLTATFDGHWSDTLPLVVIASEDTVAPLWSLRARAAHARARGEDTVLLATEKQLAEQTTRVLDAATLALRCAETAGRLERWDEALEHLARALDLIPNHLIALSTRAEILESRGDLAGAAETLEELARAALVPAHRVAAYAAAATLWASPNGDLTRAQLALEDALVLVPESLEILERLTQLYASSGALGRLSEVLERRSMLVTDPEQRGAIELQLARTLLDCDEIGRATVAIEAVLESYPNDPDALELGARLASRDERFDDAETLWLKLASQTSELERQALVYRELAHLYAESLNQPERAELAYRELFKRQPDHEEVEQLVEMLRERGALPEAIELLTQMIDRSTEVTTERRRLVRLARLRDEDSGERRKAEELLERARRKWPTDPAVITALFQLYQRHGEPAAQQMLLERAATDARRALGTGRFEGAFFELLASVAELQGRADDALATRSTLAALLGEQSDVEGIGLRAASPEYDDVLAPDLLSLPLRALLRRTGWALDAVFPVDLSSLRASPLAAQDPELNEQLLSAAHQFGLKDCDIWVSPALGAVCVPVSARPAVLVLGSPLLAVEDLRLRDFAFVRALKLLQTRTVALSRAAPVDLAPMLAAYLGAFLPDWEPPGLDAQKVAVWRGRIAAQLPVSLDPDLAVLALEIAGSIGNRASQLALAVHQWGNRAALLALGDLNVAFETVAVTAGQTAGPPTDAASRLRWVTRNPEARDVAIFSVSEPYLRVRAASRG